MGAIVSVPLGPVIELVRCRGGRRAALLATLVFPWQLLHPGCAMAQAQQPAPAQVRQTPPATQHPDAATLPHNTVSIPLTPDEQQLLVQKGIVTQGDTTIHTVTSGHVFPKPPNGVRPRLFTPGAPNLSYGGGQVLQKPVIVPVFWGFKVSNGEPGAAQDPDASVPYILSFLDALSTSPALATLAQYNDGNASSPIQPRGLTVAAPIFDDSSAPAASVTESDIGNEVGNITQKIGNDSEEIIVVFTPHGIVNTDLANEHACAEHLNSQGMNFFTVIHNYTYVSMPYQPDVCGANTVANVNDGFSIALIHEIAETITDPYSNFAWNIGAWSGWTSNGNEIGDLCAWQDLQLTPSGNALFATQPLWSNQDKNCIQMTAGLQTTNGHFITAVNGGGIGGNGSALDTDRTTPNAWETFQLNWIAPGQFSLQDEQGQFVTANNGGGIGGTGQPVHTDATSLNAWEHLKIVSAPCEGSLSPATAGGGSVCVTIQTLDGHFVTALNGGGFGTQTDGAPIHTNAQSAGSWEQFDILAP